MVFVQLLFLLMLAAGPNDNPRIIYEKKLDFAPVYDELSGNTAQLFCSLLDQDHVLYKSENNSEVDFQQQILPMDILQQYNRRGDDEYYILLTKIVYMLPADISFFSEKRLSDLSYLQQVMPYNNLSKVGDDYFLKVGFGAPDITYDLSFYDYSGLTAKYPALVAYFRKNDRLNEEPSLIAVQHNHTFGKVMGHKTSKMSLSVTRYYNSANNKTLVINYTLSYIHNLPPEIFGGGNLLINQMEKGIIALIRDTRAVCISQK